MSEDVVEVTEAVEEFVEPAPYFGIEFGQRYIDLGMALQNPNTSIKELADKANVCGLALVLSLVPNSSK